MDLLYSRYASPFDFLDRLIELNELANGIQYILKDDDDKKLWELYLHSFPQKSFNDWKYEMFKQEVRSEGLSSDDVVALVNQAENFLKSTKGEIINE